jgi:hypothetical protein
MNDWAASDHRFHEDDSGMIGLLLYMFGYIMHYHIRDNAT